MKRDLKVSLADILFSINRIEDTVKGISEEEFAKDLVAQDAVIRRFAVIGEAANHLPKEFRKEHDEISWHDVIGMRNLLVHEYFDIELDVIWDTIKDDLPKLKAQIKKVLEELQT
jgi:uncharacterized protein with HEPN domain